MGYHGVPSMPVFVYKAIQDEFSPVADTDTLVERYCGVGANITVGGPMSKRFFHPRFFKVTYLIKINYNSTN
jgi:hypothetical protein